jgi:GT2 family glycosyltransferase/glycosyltransferase involved in cell wall biosynthesis
MNILFVNYSSETSNSFNHIYGFAQSAHLSGHACAIALHHLSSAAQPFHANSIKIVVYDKLLGSHSPFPNGKPADIIHAWTPRECVRTFISFYRHKAPQARLVIHLEDNEDVLLETYSGKSISELQSIPPKALQKLIPPQLTNPFRYREFLNEAQGITYITESLKAFCPITRPTHLLHPGIESAAFITHEDAVQIRSNFSFKLQPDEKLIVYNGSVSFANIKDIRTLLISIHLLNDLGVPCRLIRTGFNPSTVTAELVSLTQEHVIELGFIEKNKIPLLLVLADILIQPGTADDFNNYRLPSKIPEFLASGRPTIIPRANIGHHIVNGEHALLLETGSAQEIADQCLRVFQDPALAARLSIGGRAFARQHFDLEKNTLGLLKFYEQVLANSPPRPPKRSISPIISSWAHSARRFLWPEHTRGQSKQPEPVIEPEYTRWLAKYDCRNSGGDAAILQRLRTLPPAQQPTLSIVMPVYNTEPRWLALAIASVRSQLYQNWEFCIADDASTNLPVRQLLQKEAASDSRLKVIYRERNGHISDASNSALSLATGAFVVLLDHDDELHPHALAEVVLALSKNPELELIYSDRDKIDQQGKRFAPYFKPDWNPDLLLAQNYLCHLAVFRTSSVRRLGGFRKGYEGSQDWDLALRYTVKIDPGKIHHIPKVLYHWRAVPGSTALRLGEKNNYPQRAAHKALSDHLKRTSTNAELVPVPGQHWRIKYAPPSPAPRIDLILTAIDSLVIASACAAKLLTTTKYANCHILIGTTQTHVAENAGSTKASEPGSHTAAQITSRACAGAPSYANYANQLARASDSEILVFLDPDLSPSTPDWLDELVSQVARPEVGTAGGHIVGPDKKIIQTGIILARSVAGDRFSILPAFAWSDAGTEGYNNRLRMVQDYTAVSAEGLAVKRDLFLRLGGFDESFASHQSAAIDFCLRVRQSGLRVINSPHAQLLRGSGIRFEIPHPDRIKLFQRWSAAFDHDPAYNRNLALYGGGFSLAFPPR